MADNTKTIDRIEPADKMPKLENNIIDIIEKKYNDIHNFTDNIVKLSDDIINNTENKIYYEKLNEILENTKPFVPTQVFENKEVTDCYNLVYSKAVASLQIPNEIADALHDSIMSIVNSPAAYAEAKEKWYAFNCIPRHLEDNDIIFKLMSFKTSMCFSLYMYVHH